MSGALLAVAIVVAIFCSSAMALHGLAESAITAHSHHDQSEPCATACCEVLDDAVLVNHKSEDEPAAPILSLTIPLVDHGSAGEVEQLTTGRRPKPPDLQVFRT